VSKVAAGAAEAIPFVTVRNLSRVMAWLSDYSVTIIGTSDEAEASLFDCDLTGPLAIVMGGEHKGMRQGVMSRCHKLVSLPMYGEVASLNVSVAAGVCLYEVLRQRRQRKGDVALL
jgi:23S rRNA (guanosine2251-2'-O)-methyltransferase